MASGCSDISLEEQMAILDAVAVGTKATEQLAICSASWAAASLPAVRYPDKVKRLILARMGTRANANMIDLIKRGFGLTFEDSPSDRGDVDSNLWRRSAPAMKRRIVMQFQHMDEAGLAAFQRHGLLLSPCMTWLMAWMYARSAARRSSFTVRRIPIVDAADAALLATHIPNAFFKSIPGSAIFCI